MKKIFLFLMALPFLLFPPNASANTVKTKSFQSGEIVIIKKDKVIERDYIITAETVEFYGTINGDLYAAGGQITIDGTVNGDLLAVGGIIIVNGEITQDARVFGGQVNVNGIVRKNLTLGAGNIEISDSALILGSLVGGAGNINLAGRVEGNVTAGADSLVLSNKVGGDIETGVGELRLTPKAEIGGDLDYWSEKDATVSDEASVAGMITKKVIQKYGSEDGSMIKEKWAETHKRLGGIGRFIGFFSNLLVGVLIIKLFPKYSSSVVDTIKQKPLKNLATGFGVLVLTPILALAIMITVIGVPLSLILFCLYIIYIYLSKIFIVLLAGEFLLEKIGKKTNARWALLLGLVIYTVLISLPTPIGGLVKFITLLLGLGAMASTCKENYSSAKDGGKI